MVGCCQSSFPCSSSTVIVKRRAGQNPGHADAGPPPGYSWGDLVEALVTSHGTLTQVAWKLVERSDASDDVASVERALRRLRTRGQLDGGSWGTRLLRVFGVPQDA